MVDVLINCLLRNREIAEELSSAGAIPSDRIIQMPDGEESWRAFYDNPVTTATTMLNTGGGSSPSTSQGSPVTALPATSSVERLYDNYKLPLDKIDKNVVDKYAALPDFWATVAHANLLGSHTSISEESLPEPTGVLRNRRLSDSTEITSEDVNLYIERDIIKRESPDNEELVVPTNSVITAQTLAGSAKNICAEITAENDDSHNPLKMMVDVKEEGGSSSDVPLSPIPIPSKPRELPQGSNLVTPQFATHILAQGYDTLAEQYAAGPPIYQNQATGVYMIGAPPEYRGINEYLNEHLRHNLTTITSAIPVYTTENIEPSFVDRYIRQAATYKGIQGFSMDLSSPDSGIGEAAINCREPAGLTQVTEIFDYSDIAQPQPLVQSEPAVAPSRPASSQSGSSRRSWQEYGRNNEMDKIQIPKIHSDVGFKYYLESPISTSQRREDDRITYINKGQFYGITLEYIPDSAKPLKSTTVKSNVMLMFREDKPHDEELKAWQFWHSRQHSLKQRILDADTKNSSGIVGQIEELTHNAITFYWNPLEGPAKVNISVQCLSTDFSNQKGVKGLPLHLQIDTFDDFREGVPPQHRGYCQIKVFCDKGAERKTRDEERRAAKRKLNSANAVDTNNVTFPARKKIEELYHLPCERSEFYSMSDLLKPPILFTPAEEAEKISSVDLALYNSPAPVLENQSAPCTDRRDTDSRSSATFTPPPKRAKLYPADRILLYTRQEAEETFQPLHIHPPTLAGLAKGIESKYKFGSARIRNFYKRNKKGVTIQIDDDIVRYYCNEDICVIEVVKVDDDLCDITLVEQ